MSCLQCLPQCSTSSLTSSPKNKKISKGVRRFKLFFELICNCSIHDPWQASCSLVPTLLWSLCWHEHHVRTAALNHARSPQEQQPRELLSYCWSPEHAIPPKSPAFTASFAMKFLWSIFSLMYWGIFPFPGGGERGLLEIMWSFQKARKNKT